MVAKELISQTLNTLQSSDTGEEALHQMQLNHVQHLPVVKIDELIGVISEDEILAHDVKTSIEVNKPSMLKIFAFEDEHFFEVMTKMGKFQLTLMPVIDREETYLGVITIDELMQYLATHFAFSEPGSIIVLQSSKSSYSLAQIARVAESEDITILSCFLNGYTDNNLLTVTLKLNRQNISGFKSSIERFGYIVTASFSELEFTDGVKERYEALMTYLNV